SFCAQAVTSVSHASVAVVSSLRVPSRPPRSTLFPYTTLFRSNVETDERVTYQIVGEDEAEIKLSKISVSSPIARALIGKQEGDVAVVKTPGGLVEFEIVEVRHL